jgi:tRNA G37 N-methylase TrmD
MGKNSKSRIPEVLKKFEKELLPAWVKEQLNAITVRRDLIKEPELRQQSKAVSNRRREWDWALPGQGV